MSTTRKIRVISSTLTGAKSFETDATTFQEIKSTLSSILGADTSGFSFMEATNKTYLNDHSNLPTGDFTIAASPVKSKGNWDDEYEDSCYEESDETASSLPSTAVAFAKSLEDRFSTIEKKVNQILKIVEKVEDLTEEDKRILELLK